MEVFANQAATALDLLAYVRAKTGDAHAPLHVVMEATGVYHEAWALALVDAGAAVSIANPYQARQFASGLGLLTKTDAVDAKALAQYGALKQPAPWQPPAPEIRALAALLSRLKAVQEDCIREQNRQEQTPLTAAPALVLESLAGHIAALQVEMKRLLDAIRDHIDRHPHLKRDQELLCSIPGVGEKTSAQMLTLFHRNAFRSARQAAAFVGLVPQQRQSGTSVNGRPMISKGGNPILRQTLYMAAIKAKNDPALAAFYGTLRAAGKPPMQALVAIMRKLVHIAFGVLKHQTPYQPRLATAFYVENS
ncbi:MAG: IS110 family transposase [Panacagrimonas sp.]